MKSYVFAYIFQSWRLSVENFVTALCSFYCLKHIFGKKIRLMSYDIAWYLYYVKIMYINIILLYILSPVATHGHVS
jgi:hypothetical protein